MTTGNFTFHITDESDTRDIREVETRAFGYSKEACLVASLLEDESARPALSLLARHEGQAIGHILFTRATFKGERVNGEPVRFCSWSCHLLSATWIRTLCRRQRLSSTLSHPGRA